MEFRTPVHIPLFKSPIDYRRSGLLMGSCFSERIGKQMSRIKLPVTINPFGILFNPASIASALKRLQGGHPFSESELMHHGAWWISLAHHGCFASTDPVQTLTAINHAFEQGKQALQKSDYLILTLGTAWVYEHIATNTIVANCHKLPATEFRRRRLSVTEIVACLENALGSYLDEKQVILTVSPVRHTGDGLVENQLSKATLIVATAQLADRHPGVVYFPAYEILMDELRDYRFYQPDMMHPSDLASAYIWERFTQTAFRPETQEQARRIEKLEEAMEHRPLHPDSPDHQTFRKRCKQEAEQLQNLYPELDFSPEIAYFTD